MRPPIGVVDGRVDFCDVVLRRVSPSDTATPYRLDCRGGTPGSFSNRPTIMQTGSEYSTATPRIALIESSMPVCWISSSARRPQ